MAAGTGGDLPLVSVCIPAYNAARTIGDTIRSVLDSTYPNLEVIINDDASTDNTRQVVEGFGDPRVRFFQNERNVGTPGNWNRALEKARGKYVGLLNHDDLFGPFWLSFAVHALETHSHIGWVTSAYRVVDDLGQTLRVISRFDETDEIDRDEAFVRATEGAVGPAYLARREVLEEVGGYDEAGSVFADMDLQIRLVTRYPLYYSAAPHAAWRQHSGNLSNRLGPVYSCALFLRILRKTFDDPGLPDRLRSYKQECFAFACGVVNGRRMRLLEEEDPENASALLRLLHENGWEGS